MKKKKAKIDHTPILEEVEPLEDDTPWHLTYEAWGENPRVFVAVSGSPSTCLRNMADILEDNDVDMWSAASATFDEDAHYLTIYI